MITISPDYGRSLPVVDPDDHALSICIGCALENSVIAGDQYGYKALCEETSIRQKLQQHPGLNNEQPLLLLRIGYADAMPGSFRRPVEEVLKTGL